jgi:hypothetical protein
MVDQEPAAEPQEKLHHAPRSHDDTLAPTKPSYSIVPMKLAGSRPWNDVSGLEPTGGVSNYLRGKDPKNSLTNIPHYARVRAAGVYDGVDLVS